MRPTDLRSPTWAMPITTVQKMIGGIGFAIAEALVRRGVNVMIVDIREDAIPVAVDTLAGQRGHVAGVRADVSVDADLDAVADETVERFGRVDLVCNNAGVVCEQA